MRYYRVKPQYDNYKLSRDYEIFVGTELLTETEYKKALLKYANRNNTRRATIPPSSRDKAVVSSRIDTTALKKDAPEIAAKYTRTTESRRFTFA